MVQFLKFLKDISKGHLKPLLVITLIGILSVGISLSFVWALKKVIDVASGYTTGSLIHYSAILVALTLFRVLFRFSSQESCS